MVKLDGLVVEVVAALVVMMVPKEKVVVLVDLMLVVVMELGRKIVAVFLEHMDWRILEVVVVHAQVAPVML